VDVVRDRAFDQVKQVSAPAKPISGTLFLSAWRFLRRRNNDSFFSGSKSFRRQRLCRWHWMMNHRPSPFEYSNPTPIGSRIRDIGNKIAIDRAVRPSYGDFRARSGFLQSSRKPCIGGELAVFLHVRPAGASAKPAYRSLLASAAPENIFGLIMRLREWKNTMGLRENQLTRLRLVERRSRLRRICGADRRCLCTIARKIGAGHDSRAALANRTLQRARLTPKVVPLCLGIFRRIRSLTTAKISLSNMWDGRVRERVMSENWSSEF